MGRARFDLPAAPVSRGVRSSRSATDVRIRRRIPRPWFCANAENAQPIETIPHTTDRFGAADERWEPSMPAAR